MTLIWEDADVFERLLTSTSAAPAPAADAPPPSNADDLIALGVLAISD